MAPSRVKPGRVSKLSKARAWSDKVLPVTRERLVHGKGLTWNEGEYVEGDSDVLCVNTGASSETIDR